MKKSKGHFLVEVMKEVKIKGYYAVDAKDDRTARSLAQSAVDEMSDEIEWREFDGELLDSGVVGVEPND